MPAWEALSRCACVLREGQPRPRGAGRCARTATTSCARCSRRSTSTTTSCCAPRPRGVTGPLRPPARARRTRRTSRRGPPRRCAATAGVERGVEIEITQAHPGGRRPRRRQQQRGRGAPGPRPAVEARPRAGRAAPPGPPPGRRRALLPARGDGPGPRAGGRGLPPPAARSGPTSWSWTPDVHVSTAAGFRSRGREFDTPGEQ